MAIAGKWTRRCQYVTGWSELGPRICGSKTQNITAGPEGKVPICVYHAQFSRPLPERPRH